jgi:hypothetical protein
VAYPKGAWNLNGAWSSQKEGAWWLVKKWVWYVLGVYCGHFGGVVGLKGAGHGGVDLKWAGHVGGVSLSHFGLKKFTQWYSVGLGGF